MSIHPGEFGLVADSRINLEHVSLWILLGHSVLGVTVAVLASQLVAFLAPAVPTRALVVGVMVGWTILRGAIAADALVVAVFRVSRAAGMIVCIELVLSQLGSSCGDTQNSYELAISSTTRMAFHWTVAIIALVGSLLSILTTPPSTVSVASVAAHWLPYVATAGFLFVHPVGLESSIDHRPLGGGSSVAVMAIRIGRAAVFTLCYQIALAVDLSKRKSHSVVERHDVAMELIASCTGSALFVLVSPSLAIVPFVAVFVSVCCFRRRVSASTPAHALGILPLGNVYEQLEEDPEKSAAPEAIECASPTSDEPLCPPATNANVQRLLRLGVKSLSRNEAQRVLRD